MEAEMMGKNLGSRNAAARGLWRRVRRALRRTRGEQGQSLVEFAFITALILFPLLTGIIYMAIGFSTYLTLSNGANVAAQALSISRNQDVPGTTTVDPCMSAWLAFHNASPTISNTTSGLNLGYTITIYTSSTQSYPYSGTGVNWSCSGGAGYMTAGQEATLKVTYPVSLPIYGMKLCGGAACTLTSSVSEVVQ